MSTDIYPHFIFIVLRFIELHGCCAFHKWKARPSTSKKLVDFIATLSLLQWSGVEPPYLMRYARIGGFSHSKKLC